MDCCNEVTVTYSRNDDSLIVGDHVQTSNAKVTTNIAIKRGDLLIVSASNVITLATVPATWNAIAVLDMTTAQTTAHAAAGIEVPIYVKGEFDVSKCSIGGTVLTTLQYDAARARAEINGIQLRKVGV